MKYEHTRGALMLALTLILDGGVKADTTLDRLEAAIKAPAGDESTRLIRQQTETLQASAQRGLSSVNALRASTAIYLSHNRSLLREAFYHLEQIAPYADYRDSTRLEKLQLLKANQLRFRQGEITRRRFDDEIERIDRVTRSDATEAEAFIREKRERLSNICELLAQNNRNIEENRRVSKETGLPPEQAERILRLKRHPAWQAFTGGTDEGRRMRRALGADKDQTGRRIAHCIENAFAPYEKRDRGPVIPPALVRAVVGQF